MSNGRGVIFLNSSGRFDQTTGWNPGSGGSGVYLGNVVFRAGN